MRNLLFFASHFYHITYSQLQTCALIPRDKTTSERELKQRVVHPRYPKVLFIVILHVMYENKDSNTIGKDGKMCFSPLKENRENY